MSVTPSEISAHADDLHQQPAEVCQRSGISRHYYAAFHAARKWERTLPAMGAPHPRHVGTHEQFLHRLAHPDPSCSPAQRTQSIQLEQRLRSLRDRRTVADYYIDRGLTHGEAAAQKASAGRVVRNYTSP